MKDAACRGLAPSHPGEDDPWFPERGQAEVANTGKMICFECKVRGDCQDYADRTNTEYGMWKGEIRQRKKREESRVPLPVVREIKPVTMDLTEWDW